jgi:hypothetical protein
MFVLGLIILFIIHIILPLLYFFGGFVIDVVIYLITGEFRIINYYREKLKE